MVVRLIILRFNSFTLRHDKFLHNWEFLILSIQFNRAKKCVTFIARIYMYFLLMQKFYILDIQHFYLLNIKFFDYKINHRSFFSLNVFINLLELNKTFSIRYCKLFKFCISSFLYNLKNIKYMSVIYCGFYIFSIPL